MKESALAQTRLKRDTLLETQETHRHDHPAISGQSEPAIASLLESKRPSG